MTADVGAATNIQVLLAWTAPRRAAAAPRPPSNLSAPDEKPFEVATINQRLASLAAARKLDMKV